MTAQELNNHILHYLKKDKTQTAIMLSGEWGSGKSYYIENELVPFLKQKDAACVVVSLYGLEDTSEISKSIYMELRMRTLAGKASETVTTGRVIAKNVIRNIAGIAGISFNIPEDELKELYESIDLKDKLLIFEDIERSDINVTKLLGYVNGLVERDGVKVLLVANENEILKKQHAEIKFDFMPVNGNKPKQEEKKSQLSEDVKQYIHIKEKTISDTIYFSGDTRKAIKDIVKTFNNEFLNKIISSDIEEKLFRIVNGTCEKNLRTFIFAVQKTLDIIERMDANDFEDAFYHSLLCGIIYLSSNLKSGEFPKWEGDKFLSTKLGSNETPLMRFVYDYIRWQVFDMEAVRQAYSAYKEFRFFDERAEYNDSDLRTLANYAKETEENVLIALKNIEKKLHQSDAIGIHAYCKLAYYMIYVGSVVGFDYEKSCELMLNNAKGVGEKANTDAEVFIAYTYSIEDIKLKEKYNNYLARLSEAIAYEGQKQSFAYNPDDLAKLYTDICQDKNNYTNDHRFLSKYDMNKILDMLLECSAAQLNDFRDILLAIYRYAGIDDFDEKDIDDMKLLLNLIEEKRNGKHHWDKIQLMQINWLCLNLNDFISQMS